MSQPLTQGLVQAISLGKGKQTVYTLTDISHQPDLFSQTSEFDSEDLLVEEEEDMYS